MTARPYYAAEESAVRVDVVDRRASARPGAACGELGSTIKLSTAGLETYFYSDWRPELVDLLVIAAAVEFADLTVRRPAWGWARFFDLRVSVHEPERWNEEIVRALLEDALTFLTGDRWQLSFVHRAHDLESVRQHPLGLEGNDRVIMPYSDGVDSRAVAALIDQAEAGGLVRVRLGTKGADIRSKLPHERRFMRVPYRVRLKRTERVESSARSRGFKFAVITGIAAALAKVARIIVTESGQGSVGPILTNSGQAYPDYRVHPAFAKRMERLIEAVTGRAIRFEFPRIWSTKGETIAAAESLERPPDWSSTRSCWQGARQVTVDGDWRQCGICAACMLRRLSMHAAGVTEPASNYVWEDLSASSLDAGAVVGFGHMTPALKHYAIAGILHMDHLAALAESQIHRSAMRRVAREVASGLQIEADEADKRMLNMLRRHRREWLNFQHSLGPQSFVARVAQVSPWQQ